MSAVITNTAIIGNRATTRGARGGGVSLLSGSPGPATLDLHNSTLCANTIAPGSNPLGGGIALAATIAGSSVSADLTNTILWGNYVQASPSDLLMQEFGGTTLTVDATHSDVGVINLQSGTFNDLGGNIDEDPRLVAVRRGDAHLTAASPCFDAGTCTGAPTHDFDGDPRPAGATCDIGADELVP